MDRARGDAVGSSLTPCFDNYAIHYLKWLEATRAKSTLTIARERSCLQSWSRFFGATRLSRITGKMVNDYASQRAGEGISNRTINLDFIALTNMFNFAKKDIGLKLPPWVDDWEPLKHVNRRRGLLRHDIIEKFCTEALTVVDGRPKYQHGQLLADLVNFCAFSGARRQVALSARWEQVDWSNRQVTLFTKFNKTVVVDFNERLEAHLKSMFARRDEWQV